MNKTKLQKTHIPILLKESLEFLNIKPSGFYIDGTLGEGGHSFEILKQLNSNGLLLSLDVDDEAIEFVKSYYEIPSNWIIQKKNFANIKEILTRFDRKPNGILLDLGLSSRQIDIEDRGFSYLKDEQKLDMRMDKNLAITAKDLINALTEKQITEMLKKFGEERWSKQIARNIVQKRDSIETVRDLKKVITESIPSKFRFLERHPEKRVFQAFRITVNAELVNLKKFLDSVPEILEKEGRIVIITFHSLESRIVKQTFKSWEKEGIGKIITKKAVCPSEQEILKNKRAKSASLRCFEKT